jgi:hypothetical protein
MEVDMPVAVLRLHIVFSCVHLLVVKHTLQPEGKVGFSLLKCCIFGTLGVRKSGGSHPGPAVVMDDCWVLTSLYVSSHYSRFLLGLCVVS